MAESKRRSDDAVDGELNETDSPEETIEDAVATDDERPTDGKSDKSADKSDKLTKAPKSTEKRVNPFVRLGRFVREVVGELRKVIWPTRKELLTYTAVVVVFVTVMLAIVAALDAGFAWSVLKVFGSK